MTILILLFVLACSSLSTVAVEQQHTCDNDDNFRLYITNNKYPPKRCAWIGQNAKRKRKWCKSSMRNRGRSVSEACPKACGVCVQDDPVYKFKDTNGKDRKCNWIRTKEKVDKFCGKTDDLVPTKRYCRASCGEKPKRPNIVVILADDVGTGDIKGYWTDGMVDMPNIKKLVDNGTIFTNTHSTPLCAPSRYVVLSGNYQHRGREIGGTWKLEDGNQFTPKQQSIAQALKREGANYHTAAYGKWHIGAKIRPNGLQGDYDTILTNKKHDFKKPILKGAGDLGFDKSFITMSGLQGPPYAFFSNDILDMDLNHDVKFWKEGKYKMPEGKSVIYQDGQGSKKWDSTAYNMLLVDQFTQFVSNHDKHRPDDPFFTYVALGGVHIPHSPPDSYNGNKVAGVYPNDHMDMLYEMDMNVGTIVKALEDNDHLDNTVVIFTSDNGGLGAQYSSQYGHHSNSVLRGRKGMVYEGGHRVPFIVNWKGVTPAGKKKNELIGLNDLYATLCDIAGVNVPPNSAVDSLSFSDLIIPGSPAKKRREEIGVWRVQEGIVAEEALLTSNHKKLVHYPVNGTVELYDLQSDISEKRDISKRNGKIVGTLLSRLEKLGP